MSKLPTNPHIESCPCCTMWRAKIQKLLDDLEAERAEKRQGVETESAKDYHETQADGLYNGFS